jgi:putative sporulation protein YtaF
MFFSLIESLLLAFILSFDSFIASFAYGTNKIKIPLTSTIIISIISSLTFSLSLFLGKLLKPHIPINLTKLICFSILLILGLIKLFDSSIKSYIQNKKVMPKEIIFSFLNMNFILTVYADPKKADINKSRNLSPKEALSLAIAISLDGLALGFSVALIKTNIIIILALSLIACFLSVIIGSYLGNIIAKKTTNNYSWISGVLLIILAFSKI